MKPGAKLSIILPIYNGEKYIGNTIHNVLSSSYRNLELLLIDDGSTDRSLEICKKCAAADDRIKVYHKKNGGIADARNYGLDHATGEYIGFCDQDDEISHDMYQKMMDRILSDGSQAAICGCCRKKADGNEIVYEQFKDAVYEKERIRNELFLPMMFRGFAAYGNKEIRIYPTIWKCIIMKKLIVEKQLRFCSFVSHEDDLIMMIQFLLKAEQISTLSDILYCWNTNISSETYHCRNKYNAHLEVKQRKLTNYITNELQQNGVQEEIVSKYIYVQQCQNVLLLLDNFSVMNGEKWFLKMKSLRDNPSVIYIQSAKDLIKPAKGFIRNTVIIPLVRKKHIVTAYFLNIFIDKVRFLVEKHYIAERIERMMKRK